MRPVLLEMTGFASFRDKTEISFEDTDYFALVGPTGAGKSTVIDAMCFVLYGCIPRYDDRRLVAPAISQSRAEARVRLDFSVGEERYTAVRVVRRTKSGASTKEARLERADGELLAGNEKEVTAAVESLLGLSFEHFTTCVVLPQGEFARFLHDKPERRQDLLVKLLDLAVYGRMGERARARARTAKEAALVIDGHLANLRDATPEALALAVARARELHDLQEAVDAALPGIAALADREEAARADAARASAQAAQLEATVVPAGVAELADEIAEAERLVETAHAEEAAAEAAVTAAEAALGALPGRTVLERIEQQHARQSELTAQRDKGTLLSGERATDESRARVELQAAEDERAAAAQRLEQARAEHRAHAVLADLVAGEPCPVCRQVVASVPDVALPADLASATAALQSAERSADRARTAHGEAERERIRVEEKLASIDAQLAELAAALADAPDAAEAHRLLDAVAEAEAALASASSSDRAARKARVAADQQRAQLTKREDEQRRAYDSTRDALAALAPPARSGTTLHADWLALAAWAQDAAPEQRVAAERAGADADTAAAERATLSTAIADRVADAGLVARDRPVRDVVLEALTNADGAMRTIAAALAEAEQLRAELERLTTEQSLYAAMGNHLSANGFEKWLLDEALTLLVAGATELLLELSGGQYSLVLDDKRSGFLVVDHMNGDMPRLAKSLSGGETFLTSLALALALADQLLLLAARGGARLESIFLDEGFGALDPSTLDTVASAIEALGSSGRMVGIISHVAELAERVPVRYEVTRTPAGSTIERVER
jgi:exonuclease SbcC